VTDYTFTLTAHAKARGWDAAFGDGDVAVSNGQSGRGERSSGHIIQLSVRIEPPSVGKVLNVTKTSEIA